jgi:SAM-dependent methyltransferase
MLYWNTGGVSFMPVRSIFNFNFSQFHLDFDVPPRIDEAELIDDATQSYADLRASMLDVRRANRFLGGTAVAARQIRRWLRTTETAQRADRTMTFLDVATGTCDIPEAILREAGRMGIAVRITGLDYSEPILRCAREQVASRPEIRLLRGDAFHLPFPDASFDYVLCSLAFHHFAPDQCLSALREMNRVARRGWLVNDLRRARSAWLLIRLVMSIVGANRLTRHDAPASVLRAYTPGEFLAMARGLGLASPHDCTLRQSLFYRMALLHNKIVPDA